MLARRFFLLVLIFCCLWGTTCFATEIMQVFPLQNRSVEEILPLVQKMVGNSGTVSSLDQQLVVKAEPEVLHQVSQLLQQLDRPRTMLRIRVRQTVNQSGNQILSTGDPSAVRQLGTSDDQVEQSLIVSDGETATLAVGQDVPFTSSWAAFAGEYTGYAQTRDIRRVQTRFTVRPKLLGGQVQLQIVPQLQSLDSGPEGEIQFQNLMTTVSVPLDAWYNLAQQLGNHDEVSQEILRLSSGSRYQSRSIWIQVNKLPQ